MGDKLRLKAADCEDLAIIAAFLQDARIPLREMVFAPGESREEPNAVILSPVMPTSPTKLPPGVTTVPPFTIVSSFITLSFVILSEAKDLHRPDREPSSG